MVFYITWKQSSKVIFDITDDVTGQLCDAASTSARDFNKEKVSSIKNIIYNDVCTGMLITALWKSIIKCLFFILQLMLLNARSRTIEAK